MSVEGELEYQERAFDIVVFGASGFTGERVCSYLASTIENRKQAITFAIAGRNISKLDRVRSNIGIEDATIISADVTDRESLEKMAGQTRMVISCVGPYRFFGESVVAACVANGTSYVDVCGEPEFIERMQLKYDDQAKANKCFIVSSCGFDSVPADLGTLFIFNELRKKGAEIVSSIESYVEFKAKVGTQIHFATFESAVHGFGSISDLRSIRKKIRAGQTTKIEHYGPKIKMSGLPKFDERTGNWALPFPGADASVVRRSLQARAEQGEKPLPFHAAFIGIKGTFNIVLMTLFGFIFSTMSSFSLGRKILLKFPALFSFGLVSHKGPSQEQLDNTSFEMRFFAKGFSKTGPASDPDMSLEAVVSGPEPGYVTTPITVVESALAILENKDQLGSDGGVMTPAQALQNTPIIERLHKNGVKFELVD